MAQRVLPFPLALHVGTDICHIARVHAILSSPRGPRFIRRVFSREELERPRAVVARILEGGGPGAAAQAGAGADALSPPVWDAAVFVAGRCVFWGLSPLRSFSFALTFLLALGTDRFAAKEAAIKAHPHRRLTFHDIIIRRAAWSQNPEPGRDSEADQNRRVLEQEDERAEAEDGSHQYAGSGPPEMIIKGGENGLPESQVAKVSISHDGEYATAVCIGFDPESAGS
jgi:holo-[acyl-carrier protein] synthase